LEIELHIKKKEMLKLTDELASFKNMPTKDITKTLERFYKKSQRLRKERERIEERAGKELDKIG
jgi:hypothetical protein